MQLFTTYDEIISALAGRCDRARVAVVWPHDSHTLEAIDEALEAGIARFVLLGDPSMLTVREGVEIVACSSADEAAAAAVAMARRGDVDVIMKGLINTDNLLRAILNKETGILPQGHVLTHVTAAEIPALGRLLTFSDAAVIPTPDTTQLEAMTGYLVDVCRRLGAAQPRVALVHCTEKSSPKFPVTTSYAHLRELCAAGMWGNAIVDGPMDLKTALDAESARIKGIDSAIDGHADALIMPDIEAGNVFYKTLSWLAHATMGGMLAGAAVPVVLPSRGDSSRSKLASLALAALTAK